MKMMNRLGLKRVLFTLSLLVMFAISASADVPPPPGGSGGSGPGGSDLPVGAPIDGGLSILLVLGAAYGAKKSFNQNK